MVEPGYKECPACAELIRERAKLCRFCGAVLTDEPLPRLATREERDLAREAEETPPPVAELPDLGEMLTLQSRQKLESVLRGAEDQYRSATILFTDIVGYTSLCEKLRAEETKDILDAYYAICAHIVDFFNGFVLEFQGDGCLAVFGAPIAYERDAECAVRAALEIRERVRALPLLHGFKIQISTGIETGTVLSSVIRTRTPPIYKVFGAPVNLAARIRSAADPDRILIGPETHGLVKEAFRFRRRAAARFKNIEQPVVTYEVVEALAATAVTRRDFDVPFLGRERELGRMREVWSRFHGDGQRPPGVLLTGEPGIGKTRLMLEFVRQTGVARALRVEGAPYGGKVPWAMWRSLVLQILGEAPSEIGTGGRNWKLYARALDRLGYRAGDQLSLLALLGDPRAIEQLGSLTPAGMRRLLHADLRTLMERAAEACPLVLILDDLQWADRTSLDALAALLTARPAGTFFLLAHRTEYELPFAAEAGVERLSLRGLDVRSRRALFSVLSDVGQLLPEFRERLVHQEAGNPFYMMELARAIIRDVPGAREGQPIHRLQDFVPSSLVEILQARIDGLDQRRKLVLQCAAVLGKRFTLRFMEFFDFIQEGLLARLYSLKSLQMLDDVITIQGLEFFFLHHVTREVSYRTLLDRQRRDLHLFVAREIEKRYPEALSDHAPILAYHYLQAEDERAIPYLKTSGDRAAAMGALPEALENYGEAVSRLRKLEQNATNRRLLGMLLRDMGRLHRFAGEAEAGLKEFAEALEIFRKLKDREAVSWVRTERGLLRVQTGDYMEAEEDFRQALPIAGAAEDPVLLAKAMNGLGMCAWGRGEMQEAASHFHDAAATLNDSSLQPTLAASIRNNLAMVVWKAGKLALAAKLLREALRFQKQAGDKFGIAATVKNLGIIEENMGRLEAAERRYREALELAERLHYQQIVTASYANLANLCLTNNMATDALAHSGRALEVAERIGDRRSAAIALENLALSHLGLRQFRESQKRIREGLLLAEELGDTERTFSLDLVDVELALAQNRAKRLASRFGRLEQALLSTGIEAERPRLLRLRAQCFWQNGKADEALTSLREALDVARLQKNRVEELRLQEMMTEMQAPGAAGV